jgi:hypothetical protein
MDRAAPRAAGGMSAEEAAKVLDVLRLLWEDEYLVGFDDDHGWWASRRSSIGHIMTANSPEELGQMLGDDFGSGR